MAVEFYRDPYVNVVSNVISTLRYLDQQAEREKVRQESQAWRESDRELRMVSGIFQIISSDNIRPEKRDELMGYLKDMHPDMGEWSRMLIPFMEEQVDALNQIDADKKTLFSNLETVTKLINEDTENVLAGNDPTTGTTMKILNERMMDVQKLESLEQTQRTRFTKDLEQRQNTIISLNMLAQWDANQEEPGFVLSEDLKPGERMWVETAIDYATAGDWDNVATAIANAKESNIAETLAQSQADVEAAEGMAQALQDMAEQDLTNVTVEMEEFLRGISTTGTDEVFQSVMEDIYPNFEDAARTEAGINAKIGTIDQRLLHVVGLLDKTNIWSKKMPVGIMDAPNRADLIARHMVGIKQKKDGSWPSIRNISRQDAIDRIAKFDWNPGRGRTQSDVTLKEAEAIYNLIAAKLIGDEYLDTVALELEVPDRDARPADVPVSTKVQDIINMASPNDPIWEKFIHRKSMAQIDTAQEALTAEEIDILEDKAVEEADEQIISRDKIREKDESLAIGDILNYAQMHYSIKEGKDKIRPILTDEWIVEKYKTAWENKNKLHPMKALITAIQGEPRTEYSIHMDREYEAGYEGWQKHPDELTKEDISYIKKRILDSYS